MCVERGTNLFDAGGGDKGSAFLTFPHWFFRHTSLKIREVTGVTVTTELRGGGFRRGGVSVAPRRCLMAPSRLRLLPTSPLTRHICVLTLQPNLSRNLRNNRS